MCTEFDFFGRRIAPESRKWVIFPRGTAKYDEIQLWDLILVLETTFSLSTRQNLTKFELSVRFLTYFRCPRAKNGGFSSFPEGKCQILAPTDEFRSGNVISCFPAPNLNGNRRSNPASSS